MPRDTVYVVPRPDMGDEVMYPRHGTGAAGCGCSPVTRPIDAALDNLQRVIEGDEQSGVELWLTGWGWRDYQVAHPGATFEDWIAYHMNGDVPSPEN